MPLSKDDPKSVGGYRLLDRLGAGGMGAVYRGRSRSGREVAVKVVHAQYAEDPVFRLRFRQEIEAVRRVSGAFTAPVLDADPEAVRPWMATQYVPGPALAALVREGGPLKGAELRRLALGLVEALRDIHRVGVVHRDLKPANVLMADDGPRVIDFGISRAAEDPGTLTETGQMIGTPPFMSPEQLTDARSVGPASDVFSVGALLAFTIMGRGPFDADSPYLTAYRVVHSAPALDGVPEPLRGVLERALAKDPAHRPGLDELAGEFERVLPLESPQDKGTLPLRADEVAVVRNRSTTAAGHEPPTGRTRRRGRRALWAAAATAGVLALGLAASLVIWPGLGDDRDRRGAGAAAAPPPSRWKAVPAGWKPWQTTVTAPAAKGVKNASGVAGIGPDDSPECQVHRGAVYCAGDGILPMRVDGLTGRVLWRADAVPPAADGGAYLFSVLGVVDGTMVVQQEYRPRSDGDPQFSVVGLDTETGRSLWRRVVNARQGLPHLSGDLLMVPDGGDGTVTARAARTGAKRWTAGLPAGHYCSWAENLDDLYLRCGPVQGPWTSDLLLAMDREDGSIRRLSVPYASTLAGVFDGRLLVLDPAGDKQAFTRLRLLDPRTGRSTSTKLAEELEGSPALSDGTLWFVTSSGQVTAVSAGTGELTWRTRTSLEGPADVTYDRDARAVYLSSAGGRVAALDAKKGTVLWETLPRARRVLNTGSSSSARVLLNDGALVVTAGEGDLFTIDPARPDRKPVPG